VCSSDLHRGQSLANAGGTGLGLAIVKQYTDLHHGTVILTDAPGGGALFQVELPQRAPELSYVRVGPIEERVEHERLHNPVLHERSTHGVEVTGPRRGQATVLVVEDNADMRRFIVQALCEEWRVISASHGRDALAAIASDPPDLIVSDLMMPDFSGEQLVAEVRSMPAVAQVPIVVLSARADDELRLGLLASSVQDYLTKPFSAHELRARVRNLVSTKKARDALQSELASHNSDLSVLTQQLIASRRALQASHDALLRSGQRWRAVYENSAAGIAVLDLDGKILDANPALRAMLQRSEGTLRDLPLPALCFPEDREQMERDVRRLSEIGRGGLTIERRLRRGDGSVVWVEASLSSAPSAASALMIVCVVEDVTERNEARAALTRAQSELARVTRATALGELATSIAHEINQPLAAMAANGHACLRWLTGERRSESEAVAAAQRIVRDAERASDVISGIRRFLGRAGSQREMIDIDDVIRDVIMLVDPFADSNGVEIEAACGCATTRLVADRVQIEQVLVNLVTNAVEAMAGGQGRGSTVRITSGLDPDRRLVCLRISDMGCGITGDAERVFEPFATTKPDGMGMGLAISRSIIESHGGRLTVEASDDSGTTMLVTLPMEAG
jgi:PAS domain S-box-containing protein